MLCVLIRIASMRGPGAIINTHKLELPMSQIYFHGSKGSRAVEVLLFLKEFLSLYTAGHSRTIVGVEKLKDKSVRLLIFDPSTSKKQISLFHSIVNANLMRTLRRSIQGLKSKQYQIVAVTGILSDKEYDVSIWCSFHYTSGPGCSKLTTSLVNVSLKFQTLIS